MKTNVILSKKFTLQGRDVVRAIIIAILTPALYIVQQSLEKGTLVFNWKQVVTAAIGGGVAYIVKNFLIEPPSVITTLPDNQTAIYANKEIKKVV